MNLQIVLPGGLAVEWNAAVTYTIFAVAVLIMTMEILVRMRTADVALGEVLKEAAVLAVVAWLLANIAQLAPAAPFASVEEVKQKAEDVAGACYCRLVKAAQCVANIRLSGPASAYAGYAEAKLSKYTAIYQQALWQYSQLAGLVEWFRQYGGMLLAAGLMIYAVWLRSVGGIIIGLTAGIWLGAVYLLASVNVDTQLCYGCVGGSCKGAVGSKDYHPIVDVGCDDELVRYFEQDYDSWRYATAAYWLFLVAAPALAAAVGFLLGRS